MVAAIEDLAFGGGLEVALGCHYRIAHVHVRKGFTIKDIVGGAPKILIEASSCILNLDYSCTHKIHKTL